MNRLIILVVTALFAMTVLPSCSTFKRELAAPEELKEKWMLVEMKGEKKETLTKAKSYVSFDGKNQGASFAGCNNMFFRYKYLGKGKLSVSRVSSTKKYCPDNGNLEERLANAIAKVNRYVREGHHISLYAGQELILKGIETDWD